MRLIFFVVTLFSLSSFGGVLPMSRGGTGVNNTAASGAMIFSTSTGMSVSDVGSANQVMYSTSTGNPKWASNFLLYSGGSVVLKAPANATYGAPLYIPSGSSMSTPERGAIESDGSHLYWTNSSGTRTRLDN